MSLYRVIILSIFLLSLVGCSNQESAQKSQLTIGLATNNPNGLKNIEGFRQAMARLGYIEGENVSYQFAGTFTRGEDLSTSLSEMINTPVDLIFTAGTGTGVMAHKLTSAEQIPVVFGVIADPVMAGVLDNLERPGGHITGIMISPNQSQRLKYLVDMVPGIQNIYILHDPDNSAATSALSQVRQYASRLGVKLDIHQAHTPEQVEQALESLPSNIDAIFMLPDSTINRHQSKLLQIAIDRKLPVSGPSIIQAEKGALFAYGIVHHEAGAQAAPIADMILKGSKPGDMPIQTADFYLGINMATAKKIGINIPDHFLRQAHKVIRDNSMSK
ncbi:MAG: ABC transporter substrate-binding protein [Gammaproteobacteria bacterium]|nr:ABC transporter substrate-binding protein [Gammaproteobacteria bacterium]